MKKEEYFARMKPRKCEICERDCKNYQSYVTHKRWHKGGIGRPKESGHKPIFLTVKQAFYLYSFLDDFSFEFNKYTKGSSTVILIALKRVIPKRYFEEDL